MDFRARTELISAVLALALATSVVLRGARKRRVHWLFVAFAANVSAWFFAQYLAGFRPTDALGGRAVAFTALLLPQTGIRFLRAFVGDTPGSPSKLYRTAGWLGALLFAVVLSPFHAHPLTRAALGLYVVGLFAAAVFELYRRSEDADSRLERERAQYLVGAGVSTTLVFLTDLLPFAGVDVGPVGSTLVLVVLYLLSQVIERSRLIDLYEFTARLASLTALAFLLAGIYYALVDWVNHEAPYVLNAIVASLVILLLFDPLRSKIEEQVGRVFFRERYDLEKAVTAVRNRLAHVLELDTLRRELEEARDLSRHVTHASLYLLDAEHRGLDLQAHFGPAPIARIERGEARALLDVLEANGFALTEELARSASERSEFGEVKEATLLQDAVTVCKQLEASVVLSIQGDNKELLGLLALRDDRLRGSYSVEEVQVLRGLAASIALVLENSRRHARIKERDRLAALGEMAAGLAHEIRNPLGGIQAAAQLLEGGNIPPEEEKEYLGIITEEVRRLDRVVGNFLQFAKPFHGTVAEVDLNEAVKRTMALVRKNLPETVQLHEDFQSDLPPVKTEAEHLRQVLLNLTRNAIEAMDSKGELWVITQRRAGSVDKLEVLVRDTGPGIANKDLPNLFIPFFTTKTTGTGLGLAISQRLISASGGRIEVRTSGGKGTTFAVVLPVARERTSLLPEGSALAST